MRKQSTNRIDTVPQESSTLRFEQIEPHFHKWAGNLCNKYFDYWELINSAWLYGRVRFLPQSKIEYASYRIKCDMIDYMRKTSLSRRRQLRLSRGKTFPFINNFSDISSRLPIKDGDPFEAILKARNVDIEQKDLIHFLTNHSSLSKREKLIMKLMYIDGYNQREVGRVCGLAESRINQIHTNLMARFRSFNYLKVI